MIRRNGSSPPAFKSVEATVFPGDQPQYADVGRPRFNLPTAGTTSDSNSGDGGGGSSSNVTGDTEDSSVEEGNASSVSAAQDSGSSGSGGSARDLCGSGDGGSGGEPMVQLLRREVMERDPSA